MYFEARFGVVFHSDSVMADWLTLGENDENECCGFCKSFHENLNWWQVAKQQLTCQRTLSVKYKDGKQGIDNSVLNTLAGSDTWRIQLLIALTGWGFGHTSSRHVRELYLWKNSKDGKRGTDNSVWNTLAWSDAWRIQLLISSTGWGFGDTSSWHVRELYLRNMDQNYFIIYRTISERWERTNWGFNLKYTGWVKYLKNAM